MSDQEQQAASEGSIGQSASTGGLAAIPIPSFLRSPAQVQADALRAWMVTQEGKAALEKAGMDAKASIRELEAARVIPWQDLLEPFTI